MFTEYRKIHIVVIATKNKVMQCNKTSLEGSIYYVYHVLIAYAQS